MSQLSISQISKTFGSTQVLKNIELDIEPGTFLTLLGPSGCGKTTLLRIIAGLEYADKGRISSGETIFMDIKKGISLPPQQRKLGFVFQDYGLWPHMTVEENVAFPLKMLKMASTDIAVRVKEVLAAVRLSEQAQKLPEKLSGGQKQRVSIARAIAAKPGLILFDEPLSNLDANLREELGQDIRLLAKQLGLTCINVTHDRREAQILSDQIALMKDGVFHQLGTPEELFREPVDAWTAGFLDAGNLLPAQSLYGEQASRDQQLLVPRSAFSLLDDSSSEHQAKVISSLFIEDRYEVIAMLNPVTACSSSGLAESSHIIKLFTHKAVQQGQQLSLTLDRKQVLSYQVSS
jgi:ABC-type Fe3+/spermidine/putrescine transport system ATPase subunit